MITQDEITNLYRILGGSAVKICNSGQDVAPQIFLVHAERDPDGKQPLGMLDPSMMNLFYGHGGRGKDLMMAFVKDALAGDTLSAVVAISEAWVLKAKSAEEMHRLHDSGDSIAEHPDRTEVLMVAVHTRERTWMQHSPITVDESGARRCELLPLDFDSEIKFTGRMVIQDDGTPGSTTHH